jgi:hypothetical protein
VYLALMEHQVRGFERTAEAILASQEFFTKVTAPSF